MESHQLNFLICLYVLYGEQLFVNRSRQVANDEHSDAPILNFELVPSDYDEDALEVCRISVLCVLLIKANRTFSLHSICNVATQTQSHWMQ